MPVLVVDDNATNRRILEETLNQWQMRPTLVASGAAALEILSQTAGRSEAFPLILLDVHMPEMDGYTVAEHIRRRRELAGTTLILLSSANQPGSGARNKDLGIAASLTKPVKQADLFKAIVRSLGMTLPEDQTRDSNLLSAPPSGRRLRVLVAEDNLVNQKLAARLLEKRGHRVVVVSNGREALAAWHAQPFDVILMDVQMPEIDGLEAAAAIRREEAAHSGHIPIVAMTAYAMKGDRENCLAAGMDRYISKPIRAQELFETVEKMALPDLAAPLEQSAQEVEQGSAFDEAAALENVGGDRELLSELAEIFVRDCPALLANIGAAVARVNATQLRCAAHALKGAVDNFGAAATYTAAQKLESMGRDGDLDGAHEALKMLRKEIDRLLPQLQRYSRQFNARRSKVEEVR